MSGLATTGQQSPALLIAIGVAGMLVIYVALKIGHFLLRLFFGLIGLTLLATAVWWLCFKA